MINPLLNETGLPAFSSVRPDHVVPAIDKLLAEYRVAIEDLLARSQPRDFASVMLPQERLEDRLNRVWAPVSHLHSVQDSPALREAYSLAQQKITEHATELGQNRELYAAVQAVADSPAFAALDQPAKKLTLDALRDFRLSGVALKQPGRDRFKTIANELTKLATEFEEALLDATEAWSEHIMDCKLLAGIPQDDLSLLKLSAEQKKLPGWLVTLKQPCVTAVLTYADDRRLRERVYHAHYTRASDQGPNAGQFDNSARIERILSLRHEGAQLLGFANSAEESLATKMAPSASVVLSFLRDLAVRARPGAERDLAELRDFASTDLGLPDLQSWDIAYASEKLRLKKYALSEEEIKQYFALPTVLEGLFEITRRVFGVGLRERTGVDVWHADVRYFDVLDEAEETIAGVYFDLYARDGKRGGAWMDVCRNRFRQAEGMQLPVAFLTCNFASPTALHPTLLSHDDALTLFHEFGHGLHHMLTEIDYPSVAGIAGVEWDAVELPSQFMENFGWQRQALDLFARHYKTGESLPDALFDRMLAAKNFHAGLFLLRQIEFALFDFRLHLEYDPTQGARIQPLLEEVRREVAVFHPPTWQRFAHGFAHIFAGGYGAGYYSYLWAELLSADAFDRFEQAGIFDPAIGQAFRHHVLAMGGSRPALESFTQFRGRAPQPDALLRSYGLAA